MRHGIDFQLNLYSPIYFDADILKRNMKTIFSFKIKATAKVKRTRIRADDNTLKQMSGLQNSLKIEVAMIHIAQGYDVIV